jgi:hypothetical protein
MGSICFQSGRVQWLLAHVGDPVAPIIELYLQVIEPCNHRRSNFLNAAFVFNAWPMPVLGCHFCMGFSVLCQQKHHKDVREPAADDELALILRRSRARASAVQTILTAA